jgi:cytochrome c
MIGVFEAPHSGDDSMRFSAMIDQLAWMRTRPKSQLRPRSVALVVCAAACAVHTPCLADENEYPEAFESCASCHAYQPGSEPMDGPSLWGVMGRRIASAAGYEYSTALKGIDGVWDRATLDRFLTNPKAFAPGLRMTFGGVRDAADRAAVLDYLEQLGPSAANDTED